jgi:hypothetical protein
MRELQRRILNDPNATEEDKEWARRALLASRERVPAVHVFAGDEPELNLKIPKQTDRQGHHARDRRQYRDLQRNCVRERQEPRC